MSYNDFLVELDDGGQLDATLRQIEDPQLGTRHIFRTHADMVKGIFSSPDVDKINRMAKDLQDLTIEKKSLRNKKVMLHFSTADKPCEDTKALHEGLSKWLDACDVFLKEWDETMELGSKLVHGRELEKYDTNLFPKSIKAFSFGLGGRQLRRTDSKLSRALVHLEHDKPKHSLGEFLQNVDERDIDRMAQRLADVVMRFSVKESEMNGYMQTMYFKGADFENAFSPEKSKAITLYYRATFTPYLSIFKFTQRLAKYYLNFMLKFAE
jgi:hypothetical protein